jgi:large subunit ribosomal protein L1
MAKLSKRIKSLNSKFDVSKSYFLNEILNMLCNSSSVKFDESIDVIVTLGVDTKKSDQVVRGYTVLPCGMGKKVEVVVLAQGKSAESAKLAGADIVGMEDLVEDIKKKRVSFDVIIACSNAGELVNKLGPTLGPKGLMPNSKFGTITDDVGTAVSNVKSGQVSYKMDKSGIIRTVIGKASFKVDNLILNFKTLLRDIKRLKPTASKGVFLRKITISSTMGLAFNLDMSSFKL